MVNLYMYDMIYQKKSLLHTQEKHEISCQLSFWLLCIRLYRYRRLIYGYQGTIHSPLKLSELRRLEEWDNSMRTNLTGQWLVSKYVCKLVCNAKHRGSIINIASAAGINHGETQGGLAYYCSKAGIYCPIDKGIFEFIRFHMTN